MEDLKSNDPHTIGHYQLLGRIGSGGMGVVYLGEDASSRKVALKLIRPELADDPAFRSRFRREVQAGQRVGGICTAKYLDADVESDHPYLVTEYIEGGNLADHVATHGPLSGEQLIGLAVGLAEAVVAMHASGVIHRDLKPTNVLMAPSGPKVVDFGISHAADGTALTQTGVVVGSPSWMAPEQAQGRETTPAVDVFSWGATVAFAATGKSPFGEGRPEVLVYRVVHEEPDLSGVGERLRPLLVQALSKDPSNRPSADQFLISLVKSAMGGRVPAGDADAMATVALDRTWQLPPPRHPRRPSPRHVAWVAGTILAIVAFIVGALYIQNAATKPQGPAHHAAAAQGSSSATTSTSHVPQTTTSTSVASSTALASASLPLVVCPTTLATTTIPPSLQLPSTISVSVPMNLEKQLAVYSDDMGNMELVAPVDWLCGAMYNSIGVGGVDVYPPGQTLVSGQMLPAEWTGEGIAGDETSACFECSESRACPLFTSATTDYENDYHLSCPYTRPSSESETSLSANVVKFVDPAGLPGDGVPSGGTYPANSVMTYYSDVGSTSNKGSWMETCTLPPSEQSLCAVILNRFVDSYGAD